MNDSPCEPRSRECFYRRRLSSVPAARHFAGDALRDWGVGGERRDNVLVCVSELATNAVLHGVPAGRGFGLFLRYADTLRLEVHDSGDGQPEIGPGTPHAEQGRGLLLASLLCDDWGVAPRDPGKIVWCAWRPHPGAEGFYQTSASAIVDCQ